MSFAAAQGGADLWFVFAQPRKIFVQPNTFVENGEVVLKEYPTTPEGVIESCIERNI